MELVGLIKYDFRIVNAINLLIKKKIETDDDISAIIGKVAI